MNTDELKAKGRIRLQVKDPKTGEILSDSGWKDNIITNVGKALLMALAGNISSPVAVGYLAVGTSSTAVAATDTALNAEITTIGLGRAAATVTQVTTTTTNDTLQLQYTWTATGSTTVNEIGIFNNATAGMGTILGHALTGAQVLTNGLLLIATYQVKQS